MENIENDWILSELTIRQDWSKKTLYNGNCKFKNGVKMELSLLLTPEKCSKMIALLSDEIVENASHLKELLIKSMPIALPAATEDISHIQP